MCNISYVQYAGRTGCTSCHMCHNFCYKGCALYHHQILPLLAGKKKNVCIVRIREHVLLDVYFYFVFCEAAEWTESKNKFPYGTITIYQI